MELFKLFGTIAINNTEANSVIDETSDKAKNFSEKMSSTFTNVGEKATRLGTKMSLGLTTPIMLIGKKAIDVTADFEYAMSEVGAISGATGDDLVALRSKAEEMGKTTKFSASESAEALKYMAMAGWKTEDMLNGLDGVLNLAAASGADLGTTSDIVTDALTAMGYSAGDAGRLADVMAATASNASTDVEKMGETFKYAGTMAGSMGYSMEDVSLAIGLMANSGLKGSMAGTSLNAIISRLSTNTNGATDCINELGVEFYNADGTARNFGDVMTELREATKGLTVEQKSEIASTVAGEEAKKGFLAILNASASDYDKLSSAINGSSGAAKEMADTMNNNLSGQVITLKSQLEGLAIQFVTLIMPYLKQGVEWLSKVCDWIAGLDDGTKKMIITVGGALALAGPVLIFMGNIASGVGSIISVGGKLLGGIGGLIGKVTGGGGLISALAAVPAPVWIIIAVIGAAIAIGVALYKNWDEIKEWAGKVWGNIKETIGKAVDSVVGFFKNLADGAHEMKEKAVNKFNELKDGAVEKFHELKERASEKFNDMKEKVSSKVQEIKENTVSKFNELKDKASEKVENLKESAVNKFHEMKEKISQKVDSIKESTVNKFNALKEKAVGKVSELKDKAVTKFGDLKDKAVEKIDALKEKGVAGFEALKEKALGKFDNLKSGISEKLDNVKNFVSNTVQKLKDFFHFDWKLPKIKLPHFSIDGSFSLSPPSIPHIGVEWYKKAMDAPVLMDKPTAFGINHAGQIMAGGEAGSEVVSGTETLMKMISAAVAENNDRLFDTLNKLYVLLSEYLPECANRQMILDTGALVGELAQPMNEELGRITHMRGRRN